MTAPQTFDELLELARRDERVVGLFLSGSRGKGDALLTPSSDYDARVVVREEDPALRERVLDGDPGEQRRLFRHAERLARTRGLGDVVDSWEPDVPFLRGT